MITDEECERAVLYLRDHAPEVGRLKGALVAAEENLKVAKATAVLQHEGTAQQREALALTSGTYQTAVREKANAYADYETARLLYKAAEVRVDAWRTEQANQRRGHV